MSPIYTPPPIEPAPLITVMIIDDDAVDAALISRLLHQCNPAPSTIIEHHDAEVALSRLQTDEPDIVFVDQMLGAERGVDLIKAMKARWDRAEYVLLTGMGDELTAATSLRPGVSDYLSKHGLTSQILDRCMRYLGARHTARLAREASARQLQTIFNASADVLAVLDPMTGAVIQVNEAAQRLLGHKPVFLEGSPLARLMPDEHWRKLSELISRAQPTPSPSSMVQLRRADGALCTMDASVTAIPWDPPRGQAVLLTLSDATARMNAVAAHSHLAAIVSHAPDAIISSDLEGRIVSWNSGASHLYAYAADQMLGEHVAVLAHPDHVASLQALYGQAAEGAVLAGVESLHLSARGQAIPVSMTLSAIREGRTVVAVASIIRDLRAEKAARAQIEALNADLNRMNEVLSVDSTTDKSITDSLEAELVSKRVLEHQLDAARAETDALRGKLSTVSTALEGERKRNVELGRRLENALAQAAKSHEGARRHPMPEVALLIEPPGDRRMSRTRALTRMGVQTNAVDTPREALRHIQHEEPEVIIFMADARAGRHILEGVSRLKRDQRTADIPLLVMLDPGNDALWEQVMEAGADATMDVHAPLETLASTLGTLLPS